MEAEHQVPLIATGVVAHRVEEAHLCRPVATAREPARGRRQQPDQFCIAPVELSDPVASREAVRDLLVDPPDLKGRSHVGLAPGVTCEHLPQHLGGLQRQPLNPRHLLEGVLRRSEVFEGNGATEKDLV